MSLPASPAPNAPVKQMSSRLLTMKFMQRASNTHSTPNRVHIPSSEPSFKRRKTEHTPDSSSPNTPSSEPRVFADRSDIKAALKAESAFEALAASRRAELGFANNTVETQWVLNVNIPAQSQSQLLQHELDDADSSEESSEDIWTESNGRQTYGSFKRKKKTTTANTITSNTNTPSHASNPDFNLSGTTSSSDNSDDEEEGELSSSSDHSPSSSSHHDHQQQKQKKKKKKVAATAAAGGGIIDYDDETAMSALDHVDLSKSRYAKAKAAGLPYTGAKPKKAALESFAHASGRHKRDHRGERHPKNNKKNNKNKNKNKRQVK